MSIIVKDDKILVVDNKIAASEDCCCGCSCGNCTFDENSTVDYERKSLRCHYPDDFCGGQQNWKELNIYTGTLSFVSCSESVVTWRGSVGGIYYPENPSNDCSFDITGPASGTNPDFTLTVTYNCVTNLWGIDDPFASQVTFTGDCSGAEYASGDDCEDGTNYKDTISIHLQ